MVFFKILQKKMHLCPVSITPMISGEPTYFKHFKKKKKEH